MYVSYICFDHIHRDKECHGPNGRHIIECFQMQKLAYKSLSIETNSF